MARKGTKAMKKQETSNAAAIFILVAFIVICAFALCYVGHC